MQNLQHFLKEKNLRLFFFCFSFFKLFLIYNFLLISSLHLFQKSDLLNNNRKLRYEGTLEWKSARGKVIGMSYHFLNGSLIQQQKANFCLYAGIFCFHFTILFLIKFLIHLKLAQSSNFCFSLVCPYTACKVKIFILFFFIEKN